MASINEAASSGRPSNTRRGFTYVRMVNNSAFVLVGLDDQKMNACDEEEENTEQNTNLIPHETGGWIA